jgi:hypothetical protein
MDLDLGSGIWDLGSGIWDLEVEVEVDLDLGRNRILSFRELMSQWNVQM